LIIDLSTLLIHTHQPFRLAAPPFFSLVIPILIKMPALRQRKRAASPVDDGDTQAADPPKKQAKKGKASATANATQKDTKPKAKRGKAASTEAEPVDEDQADDAADNAVKQADLETSTAQCATDANLVIPVDETCPLVSTHKVYVDPSDGIIYDAALNQTNSGANNNKFYKLQILTDANKDFKCWSHWGRVGERGQSGMLGNGTLEDAMRSFEKKFSQ
jgi:poly [ADP-ribose] polymerase